jgi:hypothetical protein
MAAVLPVLSLISMSRTNPASLSSIAKLPPSAEVVSSPEEETKLEVDTTPPGADSEVVVAVGSRLVEVEINAGVVVRGGVGETGIRSETL